MPMIAKLQVRGIRDFGSGGLVELGCVCENDIMAAYASADEDRLFTKYSPWGEMHVHTESPKRWAGQDWTAGGTFYAVMVPKGDGPERPAGARLAIPARVASVTTFGPQSAQVEIVGQDTRAGAAVRNIGWRMSIDNPPAFEILKPGEGEWVLSLLPADDFTVSTAVAAALASE